MPVYDRLLGFTTENIASSEQRSAIEKAIDEFEAERAGSDFLCKLVQSALGSDSDGVVHCLTVADGGSVSVFDNPLPLAALHRVDGKSLATLQVEFAPTGEAEFRLPLEDCHGYAEFELSSVPSTLLALHEDLSEELEARNSPTAANFPTRFDDLGQLETVANGLSELITHEALTFCLVGPRFYLVELGPDGVRIAELKASNPLAEAIQSGIPAS